MPASAWDITKPADTDLQNVFPLLNRGDKDTLKTQFQIEHDVLDGAGTATGRHKFPSGNTASRPATPPTGAIYFNTDLQVIERYDGAAWVRWGDAAGSVRPTARQTAAPGWLLCDGAAISRTTYADLLAAITFTQSGTLTSASAIVTGLSDTGVMYVGMSLTGTGVPVGTTILTIDSASQITMSANATATGAQTLTFYPYGDGDSSTTFELPDMRQYVPAGRLAGDADFRAVGKSGGAKTHTLTTAEIPPHTHNVTDPGHLHSISPASMQNSGLPSGQNALVDNGSKNTDAATTGITIPSSGGGGGAHNNLQPFRVFHFEIKI